MHYLFIYWYTSRLLPFPGHCEQSRSKQRWVSISATGQRILWGHAQEQQSWVMDHSLASHLPSSSSACFQALQTVNWDVYKHPNTNFVGTSFSDFLNKYQGTKIATVCGKSIFCFVKKVATQLSTPITRKWRKLSLAPHPCQHWVCQSLHSSPSCFNLNFSMVGGPTARVFILFLWSTCFNLHHHHVILTQFHSKP